MKHLVVILSIFISNYCLAQNKPVAIGKWRLHLNYSNAKMMTETPDKFYCATNNGFFVYFKNGDEIQRLSPIDGYASYKIDVLKYSFEKNALIIAYTGGKIDFVRDNKIITNEDIFRTYVVGEKKINHLFFYQNDVYLSTSFGLIQYDFERNEIRNSYKNIGPNGEALNVYSCTVLNDSFYIASNKGVYRASTNSNVNLADFNNWYLSKSATVASTKIIAFRNKIVAEIDSQLWVYENRNWQLYELKPKLIITNIEIFNNKLVIGSPGNFIITEDENGIKSTQNLSLANYVFLDKNGDYWYCSPINGMVLRKNGNEINYFPNGPSSNSNFGFFNYNNEMWVSAGSFTSTLASTFNYNQLYSFSNFEWKKPPLNLISDPVYDFTYFAKDERINRLVTSSHGNGILIWNKTTPVSHFNHLNSPLKTFGTDYCIVNGLASDKNGNIWMSNYGTDSSLVKINRNNQWEKYKLAESSTGKIIIDSKNNLWILTPRANRGIIIFNDRGTPSKLDDQQRVLNTGVNSGNLPSNNVTDIAITNRGDVWIGTELGLVRFTNTNSIFTSDVEAKRIIVSVEEGSNLGGYLLGSEYISCITIDEGDRRWVGTNNGLWLIDSDGETILHHFTMENSPLPSNLITSIGIMESTGEVFIGTPEGIVSFRSDAIKPSENFENIVIYPNPVRPDFDGEIAITGLMNNSLVKITDINGRIVYQTYANGGMATWNCKTFDGTRPSTGIYLVFAIDKEGKESGVGKIAFIH